jgi:UDP-2,3-diacylglucosamine hydrolase
MSVSSPGERKAQPETVALFVSDLHLTPAMPKTAAAFFRFLDEEATHARQLYLLGDIFEYWAGDDDIDDPFNRSVVDALRTLSDQGVALYWIAGNRDFLAGEAFAQVTGATRLTDPHLADIAGHPVLLLHGDAQCVDDQDYMAFRKQVREPDWQHAFLAKPLAERKAIIHSMREGSRDAQREKSMMIMDVNLSEIERLYEQYQVRTMIHGHTHRPALHESAGGSRYVLPDWDCDSDAPRGGWLSIGTLGDIQSHRLQHY